jgi:hypothetical protein
MGRLGEPRRNSGQQHSEYLIWISPKIVRFWGRFHLPLLSSPDCHNGPIHSFSSNILINHSVDAEHYMFFPFLFRVPTATRGSSYDRGRLIIRNTVVQVQLLMN